MSEIGPQSHSHSPEDPSASQETTASNVPTEDRKPTSLLTDPDYQRIRDEINTQWLARTGSESLSGDHQDYVYGNPANPQAETLEQVAERAFREQFPKRSAEYAENERVRAYDNVDEDPAYRALQEEIITRTNKDSQVRAATKSRDNWSSTWDRVNMREHFFCMNNFAKKYPEKAQTYANRWNTFVENHPEIAAMDNAKWQVWCKDHPGAFTSMSRYRNIARSVEHVKRKKEMGNAQSEVTDTAKGIAEVRRKSDLNAPARTPVETTPLTRQKEQLSQLQLDDVASNIRMSIPAEVQSADRETLQAMQKELAHLPYVPGENMREILDYDGTDEGVMMVDTNAIVGSVSPAFQNWSTEYAARTGRIVDVAQELMKGTHDAIDHVFHVKDPEHGVKLKKVSGPDGDLFFVIDGTHRVAASKLVGLPELPAQVENMTELSEVRTTNRMLKLQWEQRISRGLIQGSIEETTTPSGQKSFNLNIDAQVLPWMTLPQSKCIKMTKFYCEHYPNALNNIKSFTNGEKIPKEALLDEVAMNFYLSGRWSEYTPPK